MASTVYNTEEVQLQDGTVLELKPLNIKVLRKFMKKWEELGNTDTEIGMLDGLTTCAAICLSKQKPEYYDEEKGVYTEAFEEVADVPTIHKVIEVCGGIKLNDPNLMAAASQATEEVGRI